MKIIQIFFICSPAITKIEVTGLVSPHWLSYYADQSEVGCIYCCQLHRCRMQCSVPHQAGVPHWEQQCPQLKEAVLCALWVGFGENSYALAWALIGGSPPLGFGWEYSGEASRRPSPNVNTSHSIILRCYVEIRDEVRAAGHTLWEHARSKMRAEKEACNAWSTSLPGRENCSKQHPFCATAMEIIKSWLKSGRAAFAWFWSAHRRSRRTQSPVLLQKPPASGFAWKTWIKSSAKICFSHWGSLMLSIKMHAAVD